MREAAGFLLANATYVIVGLALLWALGVIEARVRDGIAALGLAFLTGIAAVTLPLVALLVAGVPVTLATAAVVAAVELACACAAGVVLRRRDRLSPLPELALSLRRGERWVWVGGGLVALYFLTEAVAMRRLPVAFDAAHIWTFKATALTYASELRLELFDNPVLAAPNFSGQDYPILQPVFLSSVFRAMGGPQPENVPLELWLVMAAFVAAVLFLLGPRRGAVAAVPALAAVLAGYSSVILSNADATVAVYVSLGAACLVRWFDDGLARYALLGGLLLGAGANVKSEGLLFAAAVFVGMLVAALVVDRERRRLVWLLAAAGITALAAAPWRLWLLTQDPPPNQPTAPIGDLFDPSWLSGRWDRLRLGARSVFEQLTQQGRWAWAVAAFLAVAVVAVTGSVQQRRSVAVFGTAFVLSVAVLVVVYWTSLAPDLGFYISTSVDRVVLTPAFLAALGLGYLLPVREPPGVTDPVRAPGTR